MRARKIKLIPIEEEPVQEEVQMPGFAAIAAAAAAVSMALGLFCLIWRKIVK